MMHGQIADCGFGGGGSRRNQQGRAGATGGARGAARRVAGAIRRVLGRIR